MATETAAAELARPAQRRPAPALRRELAARKAPDTAPRAGTAHDGGAPRATGRRFGSLELAFLVVVPLA